LLVLDTDYGEARGFPQNTKCRGTVSDLAGFQKETAYWYDPGGLFFDCICGLIGPEQLYNDCIELSCLHCRSLMRFDRLRSWWLSNISDSDAGKPPLDGIAWPNMEDPATTCFILEAWQPAPAVYNTKSRQINVCESSPYTNTVRHRDREAENLYLERISLLVS
jgi:hypothetical protein